MVDPASHNAYDSTMPYSVDNLGQSLNSNLGSIPALESELLSNIQQLAVETAPLSKCKLELRILEESLWSVASRTKQAGATVKCLIDGINALEKSGFDFSQAFETAARSSPNGADLLRTVTLAGGPDRVLRRISRDLKAKFETYSNCISVVRSVGTRRSPDCALGLLVADVVDCMAPPKGNLGVSFSWACLLTANPLLCAAVVIVVLVVLEGTAEGDDGDAGKGELGDFPEPDSGGDVPV